jgi:hypothetical protein
MFIRYFVEIERPQVEVEAEMLRSPLSWVGGPARAAEAFGERLLTEVGFGSDGARVNKRVRVDFAEPIRFPSKTVLPMRWEAEGLERLFPHLEADIEIAGLGAERTQLSISARYRPPLGAVGRVLDRNLLHRVAEATIKDFLDRIADVLTAPVPTP